MAWWYVCASLVGGVVGSPPWTPETFPNPMKDVDLCGRRGQTSKICDPDGIISYEAANKCEGIIQSIEKLTVASLAHVPCSVGYQVAVALVKSMSIGFFSNKETIAQEFATTLHDSWGVGDPRCQSGIVFFLDRDDRTAYISTGKGARMLLTDSDCSAVIHKMKPLLKAGNYDQAMQEGLANIYLILQGKPLPGGSNGGFFFIIFLAVCALLVVFPMCACCLLGLLEECTKPCVGWYYRRKNRRVNDLLSRIPEEARRQKQPTQYAATMCAICLDDFPLGGDKKDQSFLECGHTFHTHCLSEWYNQAPNNSCPLCRAPVQVVHDEESQAEEENASLLHKLAPPPSRSSYINTFYLWAAHRRYPSYITRTQYERWTSSPYNADVYLLDPYPAYLMTRGWSNRISQAQSYMSSVNEVVSTTSSSSSSSSSWGGGSSFGGGGGGGGW